MKRTFTNPAQINSRILFLSLILFTFILHSQAATIASKTTGGDWNNTNTWVGGAVPSSADAVTINGTVNIPVGEIASCASMTIAQSKTVTNRGTLTIVGLLNGNLSASTLTQFSNSTLYLGGGATIKTLNATATDNLVVYNSVGSSSQTVKSATYYNLTLTGTSAKTMGNVTVNNNLIIDDVTSIGNNITVSNQTNITNNGSLATSAEGISFTFEGVTTIDGTWDDSNNTGTVVTFNSDLTINGSFIASTSAYLFPGITTINATSPISINDMTIDGTVQNNADLSVGYMAGIGSFENMSGATLSLTGEGATISPTIIANTYTNTVNYTGTNQTIKSTIYNTLNLLSSDTLITDGDITTDYFSIDATTTLNLQSHALAITNSTVSTAGRILTACTTSTPLPDNINWTGHVTYNASLDQTIANGAYANLHLTNGGTKTVNGTITPTNLEVANGTTLDMTTLALPTATYSGTGTVLTQNTSSTPIPANKTWAYIIKYNGTSAQTLVNGNYSKVVIDNASGVSVADSASISDSLTINTGKLLIIPVSKKLTATTIANNAGTSGIYIQSSSNTPAGTLIFSNSLSNPVAATVEMYAKAAATSYVNGVYSGYKWQYFGIPVTSTAAAPTFNECYVRKYNEAGVGIGTLPTNYWISVLSNGTLNSFTAYEITQPTEKMITFRGYLVNSNYNSGKLNYTSGATYKGQHLIGNSYTSAINIKNIQFGSSDAGIIENTIYLYNTGSYSEWVGNGSSGTVSGTSPGQYTSVPVSVAGSDPEIPAQIPAMQAYLVKVNSDNSNATLSVPYSSATVRNTDLQRSKNQSTPYTKIKVKGNRYEDKMWIFKNENCSELYDNGWDGYKILISGKVPQIWGIENNINLQIDTKSNIENSYLGFRYGEDSIYTITFTHSATDTYPKLYLMDLYTNSITDISQSESSYTFKANSSTPLTRFKIVTNLGMTTENTSTQRNTTNLFNFGAAIYIQNNDLPDATLTIYDMNGRLIKSYNNVNTGATTIETGLTGGDYILKLQTTKNTYQRKIMVI